MSNRAAAGRRASLIRLAPMAVVVGLLTLATPTSAEDKPAEDPARAAGGGLAAPVPLAFNVNASGVDWAITNFRISDATRNVLYDAFDGAFNLRVDGVFYADPDGTVDLTGTTVTGDPATLSGLTVSGQFYFSPTRPALRILYSFTNPTGAPIAAAVSIYYALGSDGDTRVDNTSSGDAVVTDADHWWISYEGVAPPLVSSDPVGLFLRSSAGAAVTPTSILTDTIGPGNDFHSDDYSLIVPAGATQRIMVLYEMSDTIAGANAVTATYDNLTILAATDLLTGVSPAGQAEIINWAPAPAPAPVPTLQEWAMGLLTALLAGLGLLFVERRRRFGPAGL